MEHIQQSELGQQREFDGMIFHYEVKKADLQKFPLDFSTKPPLKAQDTFLLESTPHHTCTKFEFSSPGNEQFVETHLVGGKSLT